MRYSNKVEYHRDETLCLMNCQFKCILKRILNSFKIKDFSLRDGNMQLRNHNSPHLSYLPTSNSRVKIYRRKEDQADAIVWWKALLKRIQAHGYCKENWLRGMRGTGIRLKHYSRSSEMSNIWSIPRYAISNLHWRARSSGSPVGNSFHPINFNESLDLLVTKAIIERKMLRDRVH